MQHPCGIGTEHHTDIIKTWKEAEQHGQICHWTGLLVWRKNNGIFKHLTPINLVAKIATYCWNCGSPILPGDSIIWYKDWYIAFHEGCSL